MKIVADQAIPFAQHFFSALGELQLLAAPEIDAAAVRDADALIVRTATRVNEQLLHDSQVAFVASTTSGIDHVDTDYLQQHNIRFASAPGCNARSVAEYVLSSLFVLADREGFNPLDKQVGIIGYGHTGKQLDGLLQSCGIRTLVNDPCLQAQTKDRRFCELDEILQADIISLHVPLSTAGSYPTHHLINDHVLRRVKKDVILINTARGGVVDEDALLRFKARHVDAHIVLDVWDQEPDINTELLMSTTIHTPHIAGYSVDARLAGTRMVYSAFQQARHVTPPLLPAARLNEITLNSFSSDIEAIQMAVLSAYDVRGDSVSLQQILECSEEKRAVLFQTLRKHYPRRREFLAMTVKLPGELPKELPGARVGLAAKLAALGFKVST